MNLALLVVLYLSNTNPALAQDGECSDGLCGTPQDHGGGDANSSVLIQGGDIGDTYQYADDYDGDGVEDNYDNCPFTQNPDQSDVDADSFGDACDLCMTLPETQMLDADNDRHGDACDDDDDGDGVEDAKDNCPSIHNAGQPDIDSDGRGDACDDDDDGDGFLDLFDYCPRVKTERNTLDGIRDIAACDTDADQDGAKDGLDNCPTVTNRAQLDADGDHLGDDCDSDLDGDGILNMLDNCPRVSNLDQQDRDRDHLGDACDPKFCYVADPARKEMCLNPMAPLQAFAGPKVNIETGQTFRLHIFANRVNTALVYQWSVMEAPPRSYAVPSHAIGWVSKSTPYEYHYPRSGVATFTPDEPGRYVLELSVALEHPAGEMPATTYSTVEVIATGRPASDADGCAVAPVRLGTFLMFLRR